jgi:hypothetical protein
VSATVAGVTQTVTIVVFDVTFAPANAPFSPALQTVMIEGIANPDRGRVRVANLAAGQNGSLFRARADLPGTAEDTVPATLTSVRADGTAIETLNLDLRRSAPGSDTFVSLPLLAIPAVATRAGLTFAAPKDMEVVLTQARGTLTLRVTGIFSSQPAQASVHGRVTYLFIQGFTGSGATVANAQSHFARAVSVWAQAGVEVKQRVLDMNVAPLPGLLDIDHVPPGTNPTLDELQLMGRAFPSPARSGVASDINMYYVRSLQGEPSGLAYLAAPTPTVALEAPLIRVTAFAHEVGHHLLVFWPGDSHKDAGGTDWPESNIMHPVDTGNGTDLDRAQVASIVQNTDAIPALVVEPGLSLVSATPAATPVTNFMMEGIPNPDRGRVAQANLAPGVAASLFRAQAVMPGTTGTLIPATLTSTRADGSLIETVNLVLTRIAPGSDVFRSLPLLAIPAVATRTGLTFVAPQDMEVVLAEAGGRLTLRATGTRPAQTARVVVRGRVMQLFIRAFDCSGITLADIGRHVTRAVAAWAQAGVEIRQRVPRAGVAPPDPGLCDVDHTDDTLINLTPEQRQLAGQVEPRPERSSEDTDMNVYYVRSINGPPAGTALRGTRTIVLEGVRQTLPGIGAVGVTDSALAHEIGHHLRCHHEDSTGTGWPPANIMHETDTPLSTDLHAEQVAIVVRDTHELPLVVLP